jgi:hypothetical protein
MKHAWQRRLKHDGSMRGCSDSKREKNCEIFKKIKPAAVGRQDSVPWQCCQELAGQPMLPD